MDQEGYARFLSAQGLRIVRCGSEMWAQKRPLFFENIPPHRRIHLSAGNAAQLFAKGCAVARYSCDEGEGKESYELVCDDKGYNFDSLDGKARNQTRQGLRSCSVRSVDFGVLALEGVAISLSVFARQGRQGPRFLTEPKAWREYMVACEKLQGLEAYGVFAQEKLCAFMLIALVDDYAYIFHPHSTTESLKLRPMNALIFTVTRELLKRKDVARVSYGLESFAPMRSLGEFKRAMGFREKRVGRRIVVNPLMRPLFSGVAVRLATWAEARVGEGRARDIVGDYLTFAQAYRGGWCRSGA